MISLFHVFLLKVRLARESLLKKSKIVTKKCMLKKSERCINFFVCRNWYMQIAFLVCVAASHLPFSLFLCSRYRVFQLEKVCRCTEHDVRSLFMFATHAFLSKKVCRCVASAFSLLPVLAIQGFQLEKVCRYTASVFFSLSVLAIQGFRFEMVCHCAEHGVRSLFMSAIQAFRSKMVCRCTSHILRA